MQPTSADQPARATTPPRFSDAEFARRLARTRELLASHEIDVLAVYGNTAAYGELQYLSGFRVTREAMLAVPANGDPALFVEYFNHVPHARRVARVQDVRWGGEDLAMSVASALRDCELARRRVGVAGPIPWRAYDTLSRALPGIELVNLSAPLQQLRLVKSDEELEYLRHGAALSDLAMAAIAHEVRPGITEHELTAIIEYAYVSQGGQTHIHYLATTPMRAPTVCVPAQQPSSRVIQRGDVLITEISAHYDGYPGQILRPFSIGEPPTSEYQRLYELAQQTFLHLKQVIRAGATTTDVLDAADVIHAAGYTICDDLVHGFGGGYLPPIVRTRRTGGSQPAAFTFTEGMVLVIQPNPVSADGRMGVQVGEMVVVRTTEAESLHHYPLRFTICA